MTRSTFGFPVPLVKNTIPRIYKGLDFYREIYMGNITAAAQKFQVEHEWREEPAHVTFNIKPGFQGIGGDIPSDGTSPVNAWGNAVGRLYELDASTFVPGAANTVPAMWWDNRYVYAIMGSGSLPRIVEGGPNVTAVIATTNGGWNLFCKVFVGF